MLRLASVALGLVLLSTGCAPQMYQSPGSGLAWGYGGISSSVKDLRLVAYYPSKGACDIGRAKDAYTLPQQHAWAGVTLDECRPLSVALGAAALRGPEAEHWAFSFHDYPGFGLAFSTPDFCEIARKSWRGPTPSACAPISLQVLTGGR